MSSKLFFSILFLFSIGVIAHSQNVVIDIFGGLTRNYFQFQSTNPTENKLNSSVNNIYGGGITVVGKNLGIKANYLRGRLNNQLILYKKELDFFANYYGIEVLGILKIMNTNRFFIHFGAGIAINFTDFDDIIELRGGFVSGQIDYHITGYSGEINQEVVSISNEMTVGYKISDKMYINLGIFTQLGIRDVFYDTELEFNQFHPSGELFYSREYLFSNKADLFGFRLGLGYEF